MATAKKSGTGTGIVKWDEQLAKDAAISAGMEDGAASGQFISVRNGIMSWNDSPLKDNQMAVVILESIFENVYYEGKYDPDTPQGPVCFAFGRDEKTLAPHQLVIDAKNQQCGVSGLCQGCDKNEWGSADTGKGKACRNTRRLALIPAGQLDAQGRFQLAGENHLKSAPIGYLKLPVTSVKGYAAYVKQIAGTLKRPPYGLITKIRVVPDAKTQFKVQVEAIMIVPDELMSVVMARREEAVAMIEFPYTPFEENATSGSAPTRGAKPKSAKKPAKGRY